MGDDQTEKDLELVKKLKHLSTRFRKGWLKRHPVSEKQRSVVRKALREGQSKEQSSRTKQGSVRKMSKRQNVERGQSETTQKESKGKSQSQSQ